MILLIRSTTARILVRGVCVKVCTVLFNHSSIVVLFWIKHKENEKERKLKTQSPIVTLYISSRVYRSKVAQEFKLSSSIYSNIVFFWINTNIISKKERKV